MRTIKLVKPAGWEFTVSAQLAPAIGDVQIDIGLGLRGVVRSCATTRASQSVLVNTPRQGWKALLRDATIWSVCHVAKREDMEDCDAWAPDDVLDAVVAEVSEVLGPERGMPSMAEAAGILNEALAERARKAKS